MLHKVLGCAALPCIPIAHMPVSDPLSVAGFIAQVPASDSLSLAGFIAQVPASDSLSLAGPITYVPASDSLVTCSASMELECYRFRTLAAASGEDAASRTIAALQAEEQGGEATAAEGPKGAGPVGLQVGPRVEQGPT